MARRRRGRARKSRIGGIIAVILIVLFGLYRSGAFAGVLNRVGLTSSITAQTTGTNAVDQKAYKQLAQLTFSSGGKPVIQVNHGQSTLTASTWKNSHIDYGNLDRLNRTTTNTAYLNKTNLGKSAGRPSQEWTPTGWHYNRSGQTEIYNRGHLIAYTLTFNINADGHYEQGAEGSSDNPKNLATQSAYANQVLMQIYEGKVRQALEDGQQVIYQVTTVFRGDELMPRGYWAQALSTDGSLNFNVYIFNVQPGYQFNYTDGSVQADAAMKVDESGLDN
ncbi:DNA/RNA non-specific endonuclease [Lacticaseibacillus thailandensis]|uniref:DNA-entry nuclease n=1 Tax=Lacticaseibacillus thailandensis DSM 22698 = JCM 13996 TaxID=1423810 RepID=A0A0R2C9D9_9LACO|nr:DNA/RNA non-specific endonuclease [Lacticaseibacillus thailandensis]KRM88312.1 DNA-entry nuclease [Lacticaseibacillus thailandensis DSM 22698 = JCM 13996]